VRDPGQRVSHAESPVRRESRRSPVGAYRKGFRYVQGLLLHGSWPIVGSPSDQAPSLHRRYSGFVATTSLSVPVQRIDTISLAGFLLVLFS
jgi:hypothetical protein